MTDSFEPHQSDLLTPKEISEWARQEVANSAKAFELRVREATDLATRYATGEITQEEAQKRLIAFDRRWREALHGTSTNENLSDEQILAKIDETRRSGKVRFVDRETSTDTPGTGR
jgi:hypothetical protein